MERTHVKTSIEHRAFNINTICYIRCVEFPTWEREISLDSRIYDATPALLHFESKNRAKWMIFAFCTRTQIYYFGVKILNYCTDDDMIQQ